MSGWGKRFDDVSEDEGQGVAGTEGVVSGL